MSDAVQIQLCERCAHLMPQIESGLDLISVARVLRLCSTCKRYAPAVTAGAQWEQHRRELAALKGAVWRWTRRV